MFVFLKKNVIFLVFISGVLFAQEKSKPNVILFLVDDLGWTDLSSYGSTFYQTKNIDKLAKNGVKFTNAYAASNVCSPTRASILTGKYPARLKLTDFIPGKDHKDKKLLPPNWQKFLDTTELTMAEILKKYGYKTAHIGKWHLGNDSLYWPENQGFDINKGGWSRGAPVKNKRINANGYFSPYRNPRLIDGEAGEYLTERLAKEAKTFIHEHRNTPFFLNFWFYSVHLPLQAKDSKIEKYQNYLQEKDRHNNPVYGAMIEHVDEAIGEIINSLEELNLIDNTIIIFTSNNGGLIGNHKRFKEKVTSNYPLRSGKGDNYEGGVRVPFIIYYPKKIRPKEEATPINSVDILPTMFDLIGERELGLNQIDGISFEPLLTKNKEVDSRPLFWHYPHYHTEGAKPHSAVRLDNFKLIHHLEDGTLELYNLNSDIGENTNIVTSNPSVKTKLYSLLQEWKSKVGAQSPIYNPNSKGIRKN